VCCTGSLIKLLNYSTSTFCSRSVEAFDSFLLCSFIVAEFLQ